MIAWVNGALGVLSSVWLGTGVLHFDLKTVLLCVGASVISGLAAVFSVTTGERTPWIRKHILNRSRRTWPTFLVIYFGGVLLLSPALRDSRAFLILVGPLVLCTGFTILIYGPIQDRIVARIQKNSRK